jgi:predicted DNA-binding protein
MKRKVTVRLSEQIIERLKAAAEHHGATKTAIVEAVLDNFLSCDVDALGSIEDAATLRRLNAKRFKVGPDRLLYSLQWKRNGTPPDLHLQLVRDPQRWFDFVATLLLAALSKHDPFLRDRPCAATAA